MTRFLFSALALVFASSAHAFFLHPGAGLSTVSSEEFVGPFPSWTNVKTSCSAAGDGVTDDTTAIQTCLNNLVATAPVLWFPAGTYKITHTLSLVADANKGIYNSVIGADPATTKILWGGNSGSAAASFTGSIATAGSGASQVITLTASSGTGILPGQSLQCAGCAPALPLPTLIWKKLSATTFQLAPHFGGAITQSSTAMTTTDQSMLWLGGVAYSRFDRLTFDGQSNATILVDQSKPDNFANYFDTTNEYADDVFKGGGTALNCGSLDFGCSETAILRDTFSNNTTAAIQMLNFNALDMFVWYSRFTNNAIGLYNGAGNWRVYNSIFTGSTTADVRYSNTGVFTMRGNYSSGSNYFWYGGGSSAENNVTLQGNTILDNTSLTVGSGNFGTVANLGSIYAADSGPLILIDNTIRSLNGATTPIAKSNGDMFSIGNTFTTSPTEAFNGGNIGAHYHSINDQVVARGTINPIVPTLPGVPTNNHRTVYETSSSGSGTTCSAASPCSVQTAICEAATGSGNFASGACTGTVAPSKSVVHLLAQSYTISATLAVPASADIQIIGDGAGASTLAWNAAGAGPVLQLTGPSKATLRDFSVTGNAGAAVGVKVTNADQSGSRVYGQQLNLSSSPTNLLVNALDYTRVEMENFYHSLTPSANTSVSAVGGSLAGGGNWVGGQTTLFMGTTTGNYFSYTASNGGHLSVEDFWNESNTQNALLNLSGISTVTLSSLNVAMPAGSAAAASLTSFRGTAALVNWDLTGTNPNVGISGNGTGAQVLGLGLSGPTSNFFSDTTSPADTSYFLNGQQITGGVPAGLTEVPASPSNSVIIATLAQMRSVTPVQRTDTPAGVTDVGLYHIFISNAATGLDLEH